MFAAIVNCLLRLWHGLPARQHCLLPTFLLASLFCTTTCFAVIGVKLPISKVHSTSARVLVGQVSGIDPARQLIEVQKAEALRGEGIAGPLRIQIAKPDGLLEQVKVSQPIAILINTPRSGREPVAAIHLADTWLVAQSIPGSQGLNWRTVQENEELRRSFPGTTRAVVRLLNQLKAGRADFLEQAHDVFFTSGFRELGKVDAPGKVVALHSTDVNGDGKQDVLISDGSRIRVMISAAGGLKEEAGWSLNAGIPRAAGDADADGKVDVLAGGRLWLNTGSGFKATEVELPPDDQLLAAAISDISGDQRPELLTLVRDGQLWVCSQREGRWRADPPRRLWESGEQPLYAAFGNWGEEAGACVIVVRAGGIDRYTLAGEPADFLRLTGDRLSAFDRDNRGFKEASARAMDLNGDGKLDLLILRPGGDLALINRGFGAFFVGVNTARALLPNAQPAPPVRPTPALPWTSADLDNNRRDELVILTPEGQLLSASSPDME